MLYANAVKPLYKTEKMRYFTPFCHSDLSSSKQSLFQTILYILITFK